jgi:uncharacterized LabA/DUF88 family protein
MAHRTIVYIDGENLSIGLLKGPPSYRWLNPRLFCEKVLEQNEIVHIKYFTAPAQGEEYQDRNFYIRALKTLPEMTVIEGKFKKKNKYNVRVKDSSPRIFVDVEYNEEKRTDVNLASHLVFDGCHGNYEYAVLVTNDSDYKESVRLVKEELHLGIGILVPEGRVTNDLKKHANFVRVLSDRRYSNHLRNCLLPDKLKDSDGSFTKPTRW